MDVDRTRLQTLLHAVASGDASVGEALDELAVLPFEDVGTDARIDHHRELRSGIPEVVLGEWKTGEQIARILRSMDERSGTGLATRVSPEKARDTLRSIPRAVYHEHARLLVVPRAAEEPSHGVENHGHVAVIAAGTSDVPVAEEAALTLEYLGQSVQRTYDVGVAGVHRLLSEVGKLRQASVAIVTAGMEGALPSVVAGLLACPVIAVPTSVGYGASIGGFAALFGMLSSCAPGVTVVNIDNGFGAAVAARRMNLIGRDASAEKASST